MSCCNGSSQPQGASCCQSTSQPEAKPCCQPASQPEAKPCCQLEDKTPSQPAATSCCQPAARQQMGVGETSVHDSVKQYYSQDMVTNDDCQTGVNCLVDTTMPLHVKQALAMVHDNVTIKYFGCGPVIPEALEGCSVLDLGSGSGRDCYAISKLVGSEGKVVGVDMTDEQLAVAREYIDYHTDKFGYTQPNVQFVKGYIEHLDQAGLKENTFDVIISNCVVNLSPDKTAVLKEAYRVLKEGGELYFSDVYTDTNLTDAMRQDRVLWGECISGALHWQDLYDVASQVGFAQPRLVTAKMVDTSRFAHVLGEAKFVSVTYRLFKLPHDAKRAASLVQYKGGVLGSPDSLTFDHAVTFKKDEAVAVDGELAAILSTSRFSRFFSFTDTGAVTPVTGDPRVDPILKASPVSSQATSCCG